MTNKNSIVNASAPSKNTMPTEVTTDLVRKYLCPQATDQELFLFVEMCKKRNLNPWIKEAYIIKYGTQDASIIVAYDVFIKRANKQADYKGYKAGLILDVAGKIERREGAFYLPNEKIVGGWCIVYREGKSDYKVEVSYDEYAARKKDGTINKQWSTKPGTMMIKVPIAQAHRIAYPEELGQMYSESEMTGVNGFQGVNSSNYSLSDQKDVAVEFVTQQQADVIKKRSESLGLCDRVLAGNGVSSFEQIKASKYLWTIENIEKIEELKNSNSEESAGSSK